MENLFPFFNSFEILLTDIQNVRSSEMSLGQFAALIEDELREDRKHMETKDCCPQKNEKNKKKRGSVFSVLNVSALILGLSILFLCVFNPMETESTVLSLRNFLSTGDAPSWEYNISYVPWGWFAVQRVRLITTSLNLEKWFSITDLKQHTCMVNNPFYSPVNSKCSLCKKVKGFVYGEVTDGYNIYSYPLVRARKNLDFSVARLQQMLLKNEIMVNEHTVSVRSNVDYVRRVEDLKDNGVLERLEGDDRYHIVGTFLSYLSSHILRKELPRPQQYIEAANTYLTYLYIDGKNSPSFTLDNLRDPPLYMYVQCQGSRRLVFHPPDHCQHKCHTFSRLMKPGEIVFFSLRWSVRSESTNERSLAFMDSFELL